VLVDEPVDGHINVGWIFAWDGIACHLPVTQTCKAPIFPIANNPSVMSDSFSYS
jgi:hypothetical protein